MDFGDRWAMTRAFERDDEFLADLLGAEPRPRPRRRRRLPALGEALALARGFDRVVHGGGDFGEGWDVVAQPGSATPRASLSGGDLVVQRALADGRLAFARVLGETVDAEALYGDD